MNQESIQRNIDILEAKDNLSNKEQKKLNKLKGRVEKGNEFDIKKYKKVFIIIAGIGLVLAIIAGYVWYVSSQPVLPPTSQHGHIEKNPESHILAKPMPDVIQRHMLEHADGKNAPGIIIQYNCEDYECENDLVDNLKKLVTEYPENVYLAPGSYDGKIILNRDGGIEILEDFDKDIIRAFIN